MFEPVIKQIDEMKLFRGEMFVTIQNQDGTEEVTHLMPETNRFEDPICQTSNAADSNNLPWSETGPPWTILGIFLNPIISLKDF